MGNNDAAPSSSRGSSTTSYSLDGNNARVFSPRGIDVGFVPHGLGPCFSPYEIWTHGQWPPWNPTTSISHLFQPKTLHMLLYSFTNTSTCAPPLFFSDTSESLVLVDTSLQLFSKSYATIDPCLRPNHRSRKRKPKACSAVKERKKALLTLHCCVTESSEVKVLLK